MDLFSGIGGFALAAQWVWGKEHEIVSFCEIDPFCQKVLKKHWPDVPIHDDIKTLKGDNFGNAIVPQVAAVIIKLSNNQADENTGSGSTQKAQGGHFILGRKK